MIKIIIKILILVTFGASYLQAQSRFSAGYATLKYPFYKGLNEYETVPGAFYNDSTNERPPLHADRIANQLVWGLLGGVVLGGVMEVAFKGELLEYIPYIANEKLSNDERIDLYWPMYAGTIIGCAAAVYVIGNLGDETGSKRMTMAGSALFFISGFLIEQDNLPFLLAPVGATIAFNMSRKYDRNNVQESSLINLTKDGLSVAVPNISCRISAKDKGIEYSANILSYSFR